MPPGKIVSWKKGLIERMHALYILDMPSKKNKYTKYKKKFASITNGVSCQRYTTKCNKVN